MAALEAHHQRHGAKIEFQHAAAAHTSLATPQQDIRAGHRPLRAQRQIDDGEAGAPHPHDLQIAGGAVRVGRAVQLLGDEGERIVRHRRLAHLIRQAVRRSEAQAAIAQPHDGEGRLDRLDFHRRQQAAQQAAQAEPDLDRRHRCGRPARMAGDPNIRRLQLQRFFLGLPDDLRAFQRNIVAGQSLFEGRFGVGTQEIQRDRPGGQAPEGQHQQDTERRDRAGHHLKGDDGASPQGRAPNHCVSFLPLRDFGLRDRRTTVMQGLDVGMAITPSIAL